MTKYWFVNFHEHDTAARYADSRDQIWIVRGAKSEALNFAMRVVHDHDFVDMIRPRGESEEFVTDDALYQWLDATMRTSLDGAGSFHFFIGCSEARISIESGVLPKTDGDAVYLGEYGHDYGL